MIREDKADELDIPDALEPVSKEKQPYPSEAEASALDVESKGGYSVQSVAAVIAASTFCKKNSNVFASDRSPFRSVLDALYSCRRRVHWGSGLREVDDSPALAHESMAIDLNTRPPAVLHCNIMFPQNK